MKKKRALTIEVARREVTVTVHHPAGTSIAGDAHRSEGPPAACPTCGCSELYPLTGILANGTSGEADFIQSLSTAEVHMSVAGNELWLCKQSWNAFRETRP